MSEAEPAWVEKTKKQLFKGNTWRDGEERQNDSCLVGEVCIDPTPVCVPVQLRPENWQL